MSAVSQTATLADRQHELTRRLILDAALHVLEQGSVTELTVRAVARQAQVSERTVFRYYATRDEFLDAIAVEVRGSLALPAPPATLEELLAAPRALYAAFEARLALIKAALHTEIYQRMRQAQNQARAEAIDRLLAQHAAHRSERDRRLASANIRYHLTATTWHYYRFYFDMSLDDTVACAETAIRQALDGLLRRCPESII